MKRSQLNKRIALAKEFAGAHGRTLPEWSDWTLQDYQAHPEVARFLNARQIGWDVTDFGSGNFEETGLLLLCLRNGIQGNDSERPYAEKMLVVGEMQETPFHAHRIKLEDIINCAGGNLMIEFLNVDDNGVVEETAVTVMADGHSITLQPYEPLRLRPGQSVTVDRGVYHRFYGEASTGTVLAWEVSQVNDDNSDNYFLEERGRFSQIEEDAPITNPLWHEILSHR